MSKVIYEKDGVRIEHDRGTAAVCYRLKLETEPRIYVPMGTAIRTYTTKEMQELVADLVELRIGREKSEDKVKLIRRRESYKMFASYAEMLKHEIDLTNKQIEQVLDVYYNNMDIAHAYGSQRNADFAYESLQQVKEDLKGGVMK